MNRNALVLLVSCIASLSWGTAVVAAPRVYHSPSDDGAQWSYPLVIPDGGSAVLHLYMDDDAGSAVPSDPSDVCSAGAGDERCGWNVALQPAGGVTLTTFTPVGDIVWGLDASVLRANGGVVGAGELGPVKLGDLSIASTASGDVMLSGGTVLGPSLQRQVLSPEVVIYVPEPLTVWGLAATFPLLLLVGRFRRRSRLGVGLGAGGLAAAGVIALMLAVSAAATEIPFADPVILPISGSDPTRVTGADIDADGAIDLIVVRRTMDEVSWYRNTDGAGTFGTKQTIDSSVDGVWDVFAADLDGDGDVDVLAGGQLDDTVVWFENDPSDTGAKGTFGPKQVITSSADFLQGVFAADLDADGDLDVLSTSQADNKVAWYENTDGAGTFGSQQVIATSSDIEQGISAADLDGDGDIDILSGALVGTTVGWFENDPSDTGTKGVFGTEQAISTLATGAASLSAVDLDGDGDLDVISASHGDSELAWYENTDGAGSFGAQQIISTSGYEPRSHSAVDLDADGDLDIVSASASDDKVAWYENLDGAGSFGSEVVLTTGANGVSSVFTGDLDRDGDVDIASVSRNDHELAWLENRMVHRDAYLLDHHTINTAANGARSAVAADIDHDGDLDVVFASSSDFTVGWHENTDGNGTFGAEQIIAIGSGVVWAPYDVETADVDGDGDLDVLSASNGDDKIAWYANTNGAGTFGAQQVISTAADGASDLHVADVDGDGDIDVLSASFTDDKIAWYENIDGAGTFGAQQVITLLADSAQSVVTGDLDGDGDLDVLSTSASDDKIAWYANTDGEGTFGAQQVISSSTRLPRDARAVDMDRDGDLDVVSASGLDDEIAWFENTDGAGTFGPLQLISSYSDGVGHIEPVDMNGDGRVDVLAAAAHGDAIHLYHWWEPVGDIYWYPHPAPAIIDQPTSVSAVDLDGDGDLDALYTSLYDDTVGWFENRGGQTSALASIPSGTYLNFRLEGETDPLLSVSVAHNGLSGDETIELASFDVIFEESPGDPLTTAEANALIAHLKVYRDEDETGYFDPGDTLVADVSPLSLTNGVQTITLTDGLASAQIPKPDDSATGQFFLVAELAPDPSANTPHAFTTAVVSGSTSSEYAVNDEPLSLGHEQLIPTQLVAALSLTRDEDGDGLTNDEIDLYGTSPLHPDSDGDGVSDGDEVNVHGTLPLNDDTDGDGLTDGEEVNTYGTNPLLDADLDGDGLSDADEVLVYGTDPTTDADFDGDGFNDADEIAAGMNPTSTDTDGDGVGDATDNCPSAYNPFQSDQGGGGITPDTPDGVGDLCQNADFDGDGKVDILDVTLVRRSLAGLEPDLEPAMPPSP